MRFSDRIVFGMGCSLRITAWAYFGLLDITYLRRHMALFAISICNFLRNIRFIIRDPKLFCHLVFCSYILF